MADRTISAAEMSELNQVIAAAERLIRGRGQSNPSIGLFDDGEWRIIAGQDRQGAHALSITYQGRDVLRVRWTDGPGNVELNEPGPWQAQLLAQPTYTA